jgi:hypothetical protein
MKALAGKHLRDVIALAGFACVVAGAWQVYAPAGMIALGAGLLWVARSMPDAGVASGATEEG